MAAEGKNAIYISYSNNVILGNETTWGARLPVPSSTRHRIFLFICTEFSTQGSAGVKR